MKEVSTIGLDLAKKVFQVHGVDAPVRCGPAGAASRTVLAFFAKLPPCLIGWRRARRRTTGRASWASWGTRCEADSAGLRQGLCASEQERPGGCGGDLRSGEPAVDALRRDQDGSSSRRRPGVHKVRELLMKQRTMLINPLRGLMAEFGIVVAEGPHHMANCGDPGRSAGRPDPAPCTRLLRMAETLRNSSDRSRPSTSRSWRGAAATRPTGI